MWFWCGASVFFGFKSGIILSNIQRWGWFRGWLDIREQKTKAGGKERRKEAELRLLTRVQKLPFSGSTAECEEKHRSANDGRSDASVILLQWNVLRSPNPPDCFPADLCAVTRWSIIFTLNIVADRVCVIYVSASFTSESCGGCYFLIKVCIIMVLYSSVFVQ